MGKPKFKEFKHNPRTLSVEQADALRDTLSRLGDLSGIVYNLQTDQFVGGNQRSKVMNFDDCEVEYVDQYDEPDEQGTIAVGYVLWEGQRYGYREVQWSEEIEMEANIVANKAGGDWDFAVLEEHFDTDDLLDWGFKEDELPWLTEDGEQIAPPGEDTYVAPDKIQTDIVRGDLFEFAKGDLKHRLLCGDSTDSTDSGDVEKLMDGEEIQLITTDPPYGVSYVGKTKDALKIQNDSLSEDETEKLWRDCISAFLPFWGKGSSIYATVPPGPLNIIFSKALHDIGVLRQMMVWNKSVMVMGRSDYHYKHEPILYGWNPNGSHYFVDDRTKTTVFDFDKPNRNAEHPTMKPVPLWEEFIVNSSKKGWAVYDPFGGSGTTMIASHNLKRNGRLIELDENYCQVIVDRMLTLDKEIIVTRNGEDVTDHYREKLLIAAN